MISDSDDDDDDNDEDDNITRIYSCTKKARDRDYKACFGNRTLLGKDVFHCLGVVYIIKQLTRRTTWPCTTCWNNCSYKNNTNHTYSISLLLSITWKS